MKVKISVIGHFGEGLNLLNGQTIKTKIVTDELCQQFGNEQVIRIDTHGAKKAILKAPWEVFSALKNSKNVIIFPAHNGLRVYAPLLIAMRCLFMKCKLHYIVIGGWLPDFLRKRKILLKVLKQFDYIYVETKSMKCALEKKGFSNIIVMPNCKKLNILKEDELIYTKDMPYKLCTFSRVMKEKGIEDAVNAVVAANHKLGFNAFVLDIYGQVENTQQEWFEKLSKTFPEYIHYKGVVPFEESVNILKEYYALLFPTYYEGEGFAGTILDALSAGVPVIASDWKYNKELVQEGKVGLITEIKASNLLADSLVRIYNDKDMWNNMKINCIREAEKYKPEVMISYLIERLM